MTELRALSCNLFLNFHNLAPNVHKSGSSQVHVMLAGYNYPKTWLLFVQPKPTSPQIANQLFSPIHHRFEGNQPPPGFTFELLQDGWNVQNYQIPNILAWPATARLLHKITAVQFRKLTSFLPIPALFIGYNNYQADITLNKYYFSNAKEKLVLYLHSHNDLVLILCWINEPVLKPHSHESKSLEWSKKQDEQS